MGIVRRALAAAGLMGTFIGIAVMIEPDLAKVLPGSRTFLLAVAGGAVLLAYLIVQERRKTPIRSAETPDPETEQDLAVPGDDFDELLAAAEPQAGPGAPNRHGAGSNASRRVREQLESAARDTIVRKWGCPEETAVEAVAEGTWTDDPYAAAYFTGELDGVPLRKRIRLALRAEPAYERRAKRAAEAIAELSDADRVDEEVIEA